MESFESMYAEAQKAKTVRKISTEYRPWEKAGQFVIGRFVTTNTVQSSTDGKEYNQYLFETDDGPVKFPLGSSTDGEIGALLEAGRVYRIEFMGQEKLSGGRKVNRFECVEIGSTEVFPKEVKKGK